MPAALLAFVLFFKPSLQRCEVFQYGGTVHFFLTGQFFHGFLPWLAGAFAEHGPVALAGFRVVGVIALIQRTLVAGGVAQGFVELELQDVRQEVTGIGRIAWYMEFRAGIEEFLTAGGGGCYALVFGFQA